MLIICLQQLANWGIVTQRTSRNDGRLYQHLLSVGVLNVWYHLLGAHSFYFPSFRIENVNLHHTKACFSSCFSRTVLSVKGVCVSPWWDSVR